MSSCVALCTMKTAETMSASWSTYMHMQSVSAQGLLQSDTVQRRPLPAHGQQVL